LAVDGRCLPNGLIAKIAEKQAPAGSIAAATASPSIGEKVPAGQPQSEEERMRRASPPVGAAPSGSFPRWAARPFESR